MPRVQLFLDQSLDLKPTYTYKSCQATVMTMCMRNSLLKQSPGTNRDLNTWISNMGNYYGTVLSKIQNGFT